MGCCSYAGKVRFENFIHSIESAMKVSSHSSSSPLNLVPVANVHTHVFGKTDASRDMNPGLQRERLYHESTRAFEPAPRRRQYSVRL